MNSKEIEIAIEHLSQNDKKLLNIIRLSEKYNLKPKKDFYTALTHSIVGQQLSILAARSIIKKFMNHFGGIITPDKIIKTSHETLRSLGLSNAKAKYIRDLSEKVFNNEVHLEKMKKMGDDEIIEELTKIKGIGVWTCHMFLIFTLGRPNVLPTGDLGIKKGIQKIYNLKTLPDEKKIIQIAKQKNWNPYCSIASWYIWRSLDL